MSIRCIHGKEYLPVNFRAGYCRCCHAPCNPVNALCDYCQEIKVLKADIRRHEMERDDNEKTIERLTEERDDFEQQCVDAEKDLEDLQQQVEAEKREGRKLQERIDTLLKEINDAKSLFPK